ncbi:unnamed protein product [Dracunculus medinensis]|uniref:COX3 domain-containing protein n=1 Tax=Dracunculus medinensis TaxID=318479 RepID=A0A0N4U839_DRAME|nr:unnamed protein product [Dracunculus medinensis]
MFFLEFFAVLSLKYGAVFRLFFNIFFWCKDIFMEDYHNYHNFFSKYDFLGFFDSSLVPNRELGMSWCPLGIGFINPMGIPLLNTLIESGFSMSDGIYVFLFVNLFRLYMDHFNRDHHMGLEFSIVY